MGQSLLSRAVRKWLGILNGLLLVASVVTFGVSHRPWAAWVAIACLAAFSLGLYLVLREVQAEQVKDRMQMDPIRRIMSQAIELGGDMLASTDFSSYSGWYSGVFRELENKDSRVVAERFANVPYSQDMSLEDRLTQQVQNLQTMLDEIS